MKCENKQYILNRFFHLENFLSRGKMLPAGVLSEWQSGTKLKNIGEITVSSSRIIFENIVWRGWRLQMWLCGANCVCAVDSITDVYTVSQLKQKAQESSELFFGIMYSFVSKLDLDSSITKVIRTRWWVQDRLTHEKAVLLSQLIAVDSHISAPSASSWPPTMGWAAATSSVQERVRPSQPPQASTCWWTSLTTPARCTAAPWGAQRRRRCWGARWGASLRLKKKKKKRTFHCQTIFYLQYFYLCAFYLNIGNLKIRQTHTFKTCFSIIGRQICVCILRLAEKPNVAAHRV